MATPSQPALDPASPLLQQLRDLLLAAGYHHAGLGPTIDDRAITLPDASAPPTTLNTLVRLFFIAEDCPAQDVAAAVHPLSIPQLTQAGILRPADDNGENLSAQFRIQPYGNLLFAFHHTDLDAPPEEAMMLISPSSLEVAHLMTRRPVHRALDIGTGCGFLATQLAAFSDQVHAIDLNPAAIRAAEFNARWNQISNITFLSGNLLEPVRGQQFDLIVSNPPFIIAPVTSAFSTRYRFKHSGLAGDTFCIDLAREAAQLLAEDGYFHMIFQWEEFAGEEWHAHLQQAFANLGCDVWLARNVCLTAEEHVSQWLGSLSEAEQEDADVLAAQARAYFQNKNVVATGSGLLTLHRVSGRPNYFWADEAPEDHLEPYGASVAALFAARTKIEQLGETGLLQQNLLVSPHLTLLQTSNLQNHEWTTAASELSLTQGLKYSLGEVDEEVLKLIADFSRGMTVADAIGQLELEDFTGKDFVAAYLPKIRELLWYGFLVFAPPA